MNLRNSCCSLSAAGRSTYRFLPRLRSQTPRYSHYSVTTIRIFFLHRPQQQHQRRHRSTSNTASIVPSRINPPESTLPAPLDLPTRERNQALVKYLFRCGKSYLAFYKTGVKNIWRNWKAVKVLKTRLNATQTPQLPPLREGGWKNGHTNLYTKFALTRAEFQFLRRSRHDVGRVPIFGLLFAIMGEWLPLIVVFMTPLVPYTCRIPKQIEKTRTKLEARRRDSFRAVTDGYAPNSEKMGNHEEVSKLEDLNKGQLMHISRSLGLHSALWDWSMGHIPPEVLLKYKVRKCLQYLDQDDALLQRDGGIKELKSEELKLAAEQRGIDVLNMKDAHLQSTLKKWIKGRQEGKVLSMLLTRPSAWKI